jgi:predicted ArsR family transcriptional regulator
MERPLSHFAPYTAIVQALTNHAGVVVNELASRLDLNTDTLNGYIHDLEDDGVVRRDGEMVTLSGESGEPSSSSWVSTVFRRDGRN